MVALLGPSAFKDLKLVDEKSALKETQLELQGLMPPKGILNRLGAYLNRNNSHEPFVWSGGKSYETTIDAEGIASLSARLLEAVQNKAKELGLGNDASQLDAEAIDKKLRQVEAAKNLQELKTVDAADELGNLGNPELDADKLRELKRYIKGYNDFVNTHSDSPTL